MALCACVVDLEQLVIGLDTGLALGLARRGRLAHPFGFAFQHLDAGSVFTLLLRKALGLLLQIGRVIALIGNGAATIEFENPARDIVEEVTVVGDDQDGTGIITQVMFQPVDGFSVEMVRRFVEQDEIRLGQQQAGERDAALFTAGEIVNRSIAGWAAQRVHGLLHLGFKVPQVL